MENQIATQFSHTVTMDGTEWQQDFIEKLGAKRINSRQLVFPEAIANGCSYFMEVLPGLKVLVVDFTFHVKIEINKIPTSDNFCIAYFDVSDQISIHKVNNTHHTVGYHSKLGMGIEDASLPSTYIPPISERMYSFRLLICKELLKSHLGNAIPLAIMDKAFNCNKNTIFYYSHIDSYVRRLLILLKNKNYGEASFELYLKGVALSAFGSLIVRLCETKVILGKLSNKDVKKVLPTQLYLMEHLLEKYPGTDFLAEMAGICTSRYGKLFTKLYKCSPHTFFLREKFLLAQELLKSGNFKNICDVAYEVGCSRPGYFSSIYKKTHGKLPLEDFVSLK